MKKPTHKQVEKARAILRADGMIDCYWSIDDIIARAKDMEIYPDITMEDVLKIRDAMEHSHDANIGINWEVIDIYLQNHFE